MVNWPKEDTHTRESPDWMSLFWPRKNRESNLYIICIYSQIKKLWNWDLLSSAKNQDFIYFLLIFIVFPSKTPLSEPLHFHMGLTVRPPILSQNQNLLHVAKIRYLLLLSWVFFLFFPFGRSLITTSHYFLHRIAIHFTPTLDSSRL